MTWQVFVTRALPEGGLKRIRAFAKARIWEEEEPPPREALLREVRGLDGLVCLLTDAIDAEVMDAAGPSLRVISQMAVGVDNIDLRAASARGIPVGHTPGVLTETTADFAFALLMASARRIVEGDGYVRAGRWKTWGPTLLMGHDVHGATLGIVGLGRIGLAVARRAAGFGMRILYHGGGGAEPEGLTLQERPLDDLLRESDFVSLHVPLTPETEGMIGARELALMKPTVVLINTARGPVVDSASLYRALKEGQIAYAALDVTDPEPLPPGDPLLTLENCLVTPHIASSSLAARNRMALMAAENLEAGLKGETLPHCANPDVYG